MAKTANIQIRTTDEIKETLTKKASENGFTNLSEYMLFVAQSFPELGITF